MKNIKEFIIESSKDNDELYDESRIDNIKYDESGNACCWYNVDTDAFTERNRFAADEKNQ